MSDDATTSSKRGGRMAKVETKKRPHKEANHVNNGDQDGAAAPKRGRGRPKGTKKTKSPAKPKGKSAAGRQSRSKAEKKANKDSGDEDNEENGAGDDEDD